MRNLIIILLLISLNAKSQTRLYVGGNTPSVSPTANAAWDVISSTKAVRGITRYLTGITDAATSDAIGAVPPRKILLRQYITLPLTAQTINGTLNAQIRLKVNSTASGGASKGYVYLRLLNSDGTIASEINPDSTTSGLSASGLTNRTYATLTLSGVTVTAGQRLCIDFGFRESAGSLTTYFFQHSSLSTTAGDLPVDNTTTTALNGWFQFSQTLGFQLNSNFFF